MKTADFDFELPDDFIAQQPAVPRDHCRLLIYDTVNDIVYHKLFYEIVDFLDSEDVLVVNRSKVIPARINFEVNGSVKEIFLLKDLGGGKCEALVRPGKFFKVGAVGQIDSFKWQVESIAEDGTRIISFNQSIDLVLSKLGKIPLPPYINSDPDVFAEQYQTVYARESGSVAAPTAGLHFTKELLEVLKQRGVREQEVILHVGRGTFLPVSAENVQDHLMHSESFEFPTDTVEVLNDAKKSGQNIVAVGTTAVRVLESNYFDGKFHGGNGSTDIFIYPGSYSWKCVDKLITNFHLPKSSLLMLVASFLENKGVKDPVKKILSLYELAKSEGYRFYSFGDAMLIF